MKFSEVLGVSVGALMFLVFLMLLAAISIYSYPSIGSTMVGGWILTQNLILIWIILCLFSGLAPPNHADFGKIVVFSILGFTYVYILDDFALYLASFWKVDLDHSIVKSLSLPQNVVRTALQFIGDLSDAVLGYRPNFSLSPTPSEVPVLAPNDPENGGALLSWIGASIWNIVLGVISTFVAAWLTLILRNAK